MMKKIFSLLLVMAMIVSVVHVVSYASDSIAEKRYEEGLAYFESGDYDMAFSFFFIAGEEKGYAPAQNMLGVCYRDGLGTEQNLSEAERYFLLAVDQNYQDAINNINALKNEKEEKYQKGVALYLNGDYEGAAEIFRSLNGYSQSSGFLNAIADQTQERKLLPEPSAPPVSGIALPSPALLEPQSETLKCVKASAGWVHTVYLMTDGTVRSTKSDTYGQLTVNTWSDISDISVGMQHVLGLKKDGTVVAVGNDSFGKCNVSDLSGIIQIAAGSNHSVFLKADGTVVVRGSNEHGQGSVSSWNNLVAIASGWDHTIGLKSDGTVFATGRNVHGQCSVENWRDIIAIAGGANHTVGLKKDGTVVAVGSNTFGQCNVVSWENIIAIAAGENHTLGLRSDGTVLSVGNNDYNQCDTGSWENIVFVSAGSRHSVGIDTNGNVFSAGTNENGQRIDMTRK